MAESDANANEAGDAVAIQGAGDVAEGGDAGGQEQQQPQRQGGWAIVKTLVIRGLIIYAISSFFRRSPSKDAAGGGAPGGTGAMRPATNIYLKDTVMDLYVYVSEQENFDKFDDASLFWKEEDLVYGDWLSGPEGDGTFYKKAQLPISEAVQNNGSLYMHTYIVKAGLSPNPKDGELYSAKHTLYRTRQMNKFKKRKFHSSKNLLTGETEVHPDLIQKEKNSTFEILSFWHPNLTINIIDDQTPWSPGAVPAPLDEFIEFLPTENSYKPILYFNDYWNLNSDMHPINSTTPVLNLSLTYYPMTLFKWQMYAAQGMKSKWYSFMGDDMMEESDDDQDSIKTALVETNPYLLGLTIVVSMIHSVFEFLAFKNDIQFWRNRKSLEGLSVRSVFFSVFQSLIVVLYVMDNETNFVVRCSVVVGLAIEVWKITKVTNVQLDRENKLLGIFPRLVIIDKATYTESMTKEYDTLAFKYLSWLLFPLLGCYAVYSLFYVEHRGWYSWILGMMYGFLLTFGFIMMTPQLFINYKLKSVAHLPWRMLTYKALNTFIDDLFAFVIKMPTLYRLGCFRDDIIFVIYVYQRYIYRVDPKRMNEFGTSGDMHEQNGEATQPIEAEPQASIEPKPDQDKKDD